jgi:hypothetical protein
LPGPPENLADHRFFLGGIRQEDAAGGFVLSLGGLDHHSVIQWSEFHIP